MPLRQFVSKLSPRGWAAVGGASAVAIVFLVLASGARRRRCVAALPVRVNGRVGRGDARQQVRYFLANGHTGHPELASRAAVALHQDTNRVAAVASVEFSRCCPDAAFEAVAHHARAPTDIALQRHSGFSGF